MKLIVAASGLILLLFVVGHMAGNLQVFLGQDAFNRYGEKLREFPALLLLARLVIALSAIIHIAASLRLAVLNRRARPIGYAKKQSVAASFSSRTMVLSGSMILAFVTYHLAHFTWRISNPEYQRFTDAAGRPDIYSMVLRAFESPLISITYIAAMILLGFHLSHGIASVFQTLGLATTRTLPRYQRAALVITVVLLGGYISIPVAIIFGIYP
jgi:succinate dehydrogenase / fumarate reductase cytochrome b subunit